MNHIISLNLNVIEMGNKLVIALKEYPIKIETAYWKYNSNNNNYELWISTNAVTTIGPNKVYNIIKNLLKKNNSEILFQYINLCNQHYMEAKYIKKLKIKNHYLDFFIY